MVVEVMKRSTRSEPSLISTRRHVIGEHMAGAIPGYLGHIPGSRTEADVSFGIPCRNIDACRHARSRSTYDPQAHSKSQRDVADQLSRTAPPARAPMHDNRGNAHPSAGDTQHSRIPVDGEQKFHLQSNIGLTSHTHEGRGDFGKLRGYGSASRAISGFTGHVPGKFSENVFADGWSKMTERSVASHLRAVRKGPKEMSLLTQGGTIVAPISADTLAEVPIRNPSYQCRTKGWSDCEFTGMQVDPAGRNGPKDRQEGYSGVAPPASRNQIHGYAGWVPGRVGESVVGERQCKTNDISNHLYLKNRMRITQR